MDSPDKKSVEEQRVKPTVIRRRTKETPPPATTPPIETTVKAKAEKSAESAPLKTVSTPTPLSEEIIPVSLPPLPEKEEKVKKGPRRKKSKAELELEEIQKAGGLKQYAQQTTTPAPDWEPSVERVFEPGLTLGRRKKPPRREFKKTTITETKTEKKVIDI